MEAASALSEFPRLVIRVILDYCDSHKNYIWHEYAAAVASAYARELFSHLPLEETIPIQINAFLQAFKNGKIEEIELWIPIVGVDARDPRTGRSALSFAAEDGNILVAKTLLENHALVNMRQYSQSGNKGKIGPERASGRTELGWAVGQGHTEMAELLLRHGAHPDSKNSMGHTALHYACMHNNRRIARVLLDNGADSWRPVHEAIFQSSLETLRVILEYQPLLDVNINGADRGASLHFAVKIRSLEAVKLLLRHGATPDIRMTEDITPLHMAAAGGWIEVIRVLVEAGSSLNTKDLLLLETPLHKAARNRQSEACRVLIKYGSSPQEQKIDGKDYETILELAHQYPEDWGVDPNRVAYLS
ncbi:hypothetical protein N7493_008629 [Penicillium malachiteum]|uniref:Uncharacterized protein n=1 Tax=Penicillium malachiteum TaxID=1324776 RepID=A0AAD6HHV5_9EURO|nr:hypothetical protein N7493_008629 [Penicillium malachiteum]